MTTADEHSYEFGPFRLDLRLRLLLRGEDSISLTPKLFETLLMLVENRGEVVTKDELMSRVWPDTVVEERSLSQNIFLLRKALGEDAKGRTYIETVPKTGYRFLAEARECGARGGALLIEKHDRLRIACEETDVITHEKRLSPGAEPALLIVGAPISASRVKRSAALVIFLALALIGAAGFRVWIGSNGAAALPRVKSIAVLPFKPLAADAKDDYLGLGMADTLI